MRHSASCLPYRVGYRHGIIGSYLGRYLIDCPENSQLRVFVFMFHVDPQWGDDARFLMALRIARQVVFPGMALVLVGRHVQVGVFAAMCLCGRPLVIRFPPLSTADGCPMGLLRMIDAPRPLWGRVALGNRFVFHGQEASALLEVGRLLWHL